jgi:pyrimidine operon attenuation protein/uracil phosphoribosyltransferase
MRPDFAAPSAVEPVVPATPPGDASLDDSRVVMTEADVARVLRRIAHEILEHNKGAADLVVLGIPTRGVALAHRLAALIEEVEGVPVAVGALDVTMHRDDLRRQPTRSPMHTDIPPTGIDD